MLAAEGDYLHQGRLQNADHEIERHEPEPPELPLDDQTEAPEEDHVPDQMLEIGVHETRAEPLERVQAVAAHEHERFTMVLLHADRGDEDDDVRHDQTDSPLGPVVDRGVGSVG